MQSNAQTACSADQSASQFIHAADACAQAMKRAMQSVQNIQQGARRMQEIFGVLTALPFRPASWLARNPAKVVTRVQDIPGVAGVQLLQDVLAQAERAPGWVEYDISHSVSGVVQTKMSYMQNVDALYLGSAVYKRLAARA